MARKQAPALPEAGFHEKVRLRDIRVDYRTDGGYARPLNQRRADKMAAEFDPQAMGVLLLSMRDDGSLWMIDGQHRTYAALANGQEEAAGYVLIDLTLPQEAQYYRMFGDYLKQTAMDRFLANAIAGDDETLAIIDLVEGHGLTMDSSVSHAKGTISAAEALLKIRRQFGIDHLDSVLGFLREAFNGNPNAYTHQTMLGTALFLERFAKHEKYQPKKLMQKLQELDLVGVKKVAARHMGIDNNSVATTFGKALRDIHDAQHQERNRLGDWKRIMVRPEVAKTRTIEGRKLRVFRDAADEATPHLNSRVKSTKRR